MDISSIAKFRNIVLIALLAVFTAFALWVRMLPADGLFTETLPNLLGNDPWYMLRQIEAMTANSLQYPWFDPMTFYPYGTDNFWGPLFPMIGSIMCIIAGASTRYDIMYVSSTLPALMGAATVVLMYFVGTKVEDRKTGIITALFTAIVAGQFLYRSLFGFVDHHVAETFFGAIFCLIYIAYIAYVREHPIDFADKESLKIPALIAVLCGIAYVMGLANMPTMILYALIAAIYTGLQFIWDRVNGKTTEYLVLLNTVTFVVAILGFFVIGLHHAGMSLARYSLGHPVAYIALIIATLVLYGIERGLKDKPLSYYAGAIAGMCVAGFLFVIFVTPEIYNFVIDGLYSFFGYSATLLTIQEAKHLEFDGAWASFNFGLILMVLGFITAAYRFLKEYKQTYLFVIIWSLMMLYATTIQIRYEYYLAVNIALLGGIFVAWAAEYGLKDLMLLIGIKPEKSEKPAEAEVAEDNADDNAANAAGKKSKKAAKKAKPVAKKEHANTLAAGVLIFAILVSIPFIYYSGTQDVALGIAMKNGGMTPDWEEALSWMGENTPDTGIDYYGIYTRSSYENPEEAYGVMTWWDYGHWITFISKRAPNSNPFQEGVAGKNGAAAYFVLKDEAASNAILDNLDTRYVITDAEMDTAKFWAMCTWYNSSAGTGPYQQTFAMINPDKSISTGNLYTEKYYNTMISRLHNLDGSMVDPSAVYYVEYVDGSLYSIPIPIVTAAQEMNYTEAKAAADAYNANARAGTGAGVYSLSLTDPSGEVPALEHYRLIHESPSSPFSNARNVKYVKVFEYVKGAKIKGDGIIDIDLESDQGRKFTYSQRSTDGYFTVPYSTTGDNYGTRVLSDYRIRGTTQTFKVSEDAVMNGLSVN